MPNLPARFLCALAVCVAILGQSATLPSADATERARPVVEMAKASPPTLTYRYDPVEVRTYWDYHHPMHQITGSQAFYLAAWLNAIVRARVLAYLVAIDRAKTQTCGSPAACADLARRAFSIYAPGFAGQAPTVMYCESGGNPRASNGGRFLGLFQQMASAWASRAASYGMSGRSAFDPWANAVVSAHMVQGDGGWGQWQCKP